jgi:hypothetical protein
MILPGKHLRNDRSIIHVGAEILAHVGDGRTVSELWERLRVSKSAPDDVAALSFDWFILALVFLFAIRALESRDGQIFVGTRT